jgi:membrane-associated phospholipid phosphatase
MSSARRASAVIAAVLTLGLCSGVQAQSAEPEALQPWELLGSNLGRIYGWPNILYSLGAVAVTPPLVYWADEPVQEYFQKHDPLTNTFGDVTVLVGYIVPVVVPAAIYAIGAIDDQSELTTAGSAAIQAVVVTTVVVATLKWLTDRSTPFPDGDPNNKRWSHEFLTDSANADDWNFNPFDLEWALDWPSGHTASAMALVSSLVAFYPDEVWLPIVGYPYALAIGIGMVEGDFHWLSDIVAGGLIGFVIGWQVGAGFRERYDARKRGEREEASARLDLSAEPLGLRLSGQF